MGRSDGPRPIVYLGPSLPLDEAQRLLTADYRPPVRRGDLPERYDGTVVIIDGEFGQSLSVSPNEVLRLLDAGTRVVGASSMGALRAAELYPYGMVGYGWIFEEYRSGRIMADDEVAVTYSPFDLKSLTVPLVNVRHWLECLKEAGQVDAATAGRLFGRARRVFYADRSEERLFLEWQNAVGATTLQQLLRVSEEGITDVKAADARLTLLAVSRETSSDAREEISHGRKR